MANEMEDRIRQVEQAVAALEAQMRRQLARAQRGRWLALAGGVLVIAIVFVYVSVLTAKINKEVNPESLALLLSQRAEEQLPDIEAALTAQAPKAISELRAGMLSHLAPLRQTAEARTLGLVDTFIARLDAKVDEMVGEMLATHKEQLQSVIDVVTVPGMDAKLQEEFRTDLEELVGVKMDETFAQFDEAMTNVEQRLDRLALPDAQLTNEERLHKQAIIAVTTMLNEAPAAILESTAPTPPR